MAAAKGHLDQEFKNIKSTIPKTPQLPPYPADTEIEHQQDLTNLKNKSTCVYCLIWRNSTIYLTWIRQEYFLADHQ